MTLLNDPEWSRWNDREIARQCAVGNRFITNLRLLSPAFVNGSQIDEPRLVTRGGIYPMDMLHRPACPRHSATSQVIFTSSSRDACACLYPAKLIAGDDRMTTTV